MVQKICTSPPASGTSMQHQTTSVRPIGRRQRNYLAHLSQIDLQRHLLSRGTTLLLFLASVAFLLSAGRFAAAGRKACDAFGQVIQVVGFWTDRLDEDPAGFFANFDRFIKLKRDRFHNHSRSSAQRHDRDGTETEIRCQASDANFPPLRSFLPFRYSGRVETAHPYLDTPA
jgi:hypothetical protein